MYVIIFQLNSSIMLLSVQMYLTKRYRNRDTDYRNVLISYIFNERRVRTNGWLAMTGA